MVFTLFSCEKSWVRIFPSLLFVINKEGDVKLNLQGHSQRLVHIVSLLHHTGTTRDKLTVHAEGFKQFIVSFTVYLSFPCYEPYEATI